MKTTKVSILRMTFGAVVLIASIGVGFAQEHPVAPVNQSSLQTERTSVCVPQLKNAPTNNSMTLERRVAKVWVPSRRTRKALETSRTKGGVNSQCLRPELTIFSHPCSWVRPKFSS